MSEETEGGYNPIQMSGFVNGDMWVLRAQSGEEFAEVAKDLAKHMPEALKGINSFKQSIVATGVFTGDSAKKGSASEGKPRAADTPPPATSGGSSSGDAPTCKHGAMTDLSDKNYKYTHYCPLKTDNWKERCRPVKV